MNIESVKYANEFGTAIEVVVDGNCFVVPYPVKTWRRVLLERWISEGNSIAPFRSEQESLDAAKKKRKKELKDWANKADADLSQQDIWQEIVLLHNSINLVSERGYARVPFRMRLLTVEQANSLLNRAISAFISREQQRLALNQQVDSASSIEELPNVPAE
jgi:hypothetical protein